MRRRRVLAPLALLLLAAAPALGQERPQGRLAGELAEYFSARTWSRATWGALVVSLTRGDTLFSWHADRRFIPASNAKLFTTAAALHYLGADFRFLTVLFADGPIRNGELYGDLVLYGTGDPTFALDTASLAPFADSVAFAGIRRVRGDVVGDASFLGAELRGPGWSPDNVDEPYAAPPSALGAAENRIRLIVEPGERVGSPARWRIEPASDFYAISSVVVTARPGTRTRIEVRRGRSRGVVELSGTIPITRGAWGTWLVVEEPAVFAAGLLRRLLDARGVVVTGGTRSVVEDAPERARLMLRRSRQRDDPFRGALAVRRSPPLDALVTMINHRSHNLSAELAFRAIGRVARNAGTFAAGAQAVAEFLTRDVGIPVSDVQVTDGSGLSLLDEATPRALVRLLAHMRRPEGSAFYRSLPLFGDGYTDRLAGTAAAGRLRAKTGTLSTVSALTGYLTTLEGEELAFALIVNDAPSIRRARDVQDSVSVRLSQFARAAPAASRPGGL
jgi:D-alanyl-D-alanine carboxypeptidase/D-alanyl-D-alanine-endopeptidase (penicillin-binding protein 4)